MIDTMFFLLVFFMIATLTMTMQRGMQVNLPHAATARDEIRKVYTLTLTKEGKLFFDRDELSSAKDVSSRLAALGDQAVQSSVVINADRAVEHGRVIEVMDEARKAGVTKIAVAVRPSTI